MKLLKIENDAGDYEASDAVLMIVPDEYDKEEVLNITFGIKIIEPIITEEINIGNECDFYLYRPYSG